MKRRLLALFFALSMIFALVSCGNNGQNSTATTADPNSTQTPTAGSDNSQTPAPVDVRVYTLNGTTGFGMAKLMEDAKNGAITTENYTFDVKSDAADVLAALASGSADIAALPTNAASTIYNRTQGNVEILAINTLGCLFLLNTGSNAITSIAQLGGKTVYAPAQNPTFILTYLCRQNGLTVVNEPTTKTNEVYIDSTSYAKPANLRDAVASGKVELAVLPEPMVTIAVNKGKTNSPAVDVKVELDLTEKWDEIPGKANTLVQGCVVVRKTFLEQNPQAVANFLTAYKASIDYLNANAADASALIAKHGIFDNANIAKAAIPKCNVKYINGAEMKTAVSAYLSILAEINIESIGGKLPQDNFYYVK